MFSALRRLGKQLNFFSAYSPDGPSLQNGWYVEANFEDAERRVLSHLIRRNDHAEG
jgi:(2Fe-2S) ferredoxin